MTTVLALSLLYEAVTTRFAGEVVSRLTFEANPLDGETVTVDAKVYVFEETLTDVDGHVLIGGTAAESVDNLIAAIGLGDGAGTAYAASTTLHPAAFAIAAPGDAADVAARSAELGPITVATTVTDASWSTGAVPLQTFGWREPFVVVDGTASRIVWVPGDDGKLGDIEPARSPGRDPRPLATIGELFTVHLFAVDASDPENEAKQYTAARLLLDAWLRAVSLAPFHGTVALRSASWVKPGATRSFGATIRVVASIESMVPDAPLTYAPTPMEAEQTAEELDQTDDPELIPAES